MCSPPGGISPRFYVGLYVIYRDFKALSKWDAHPSGLLQGYPTKGMWWGGSLSYLWPLATGMNGWTLFFGTATGKQLLNLGGQRFWPALGGNPLAVSVNPRLTIAVRRFPAKSQETWQELKMSPNVYIWGYPKWLETSVFFSLQEAIDPPTQVLFKTYCKADCQVYPKID